MLPSLTRDYLLIVKTAQDPRKRENSKEDMRRADVPLDWAGEWIHRRSFLRGLGRERVPQRGTRAMCSHQASWVTPVSATRNAS